MRKKKRYFVSIANLATVLLFAVLERRAHAAVLFYFTYVFKSAVITDSIISVYIGMFTVYMSFIFILSNVSNNSRIGLYKYVTKYEGVFSQLVNIIISMVIAYFALHWYNQIFIHIIILLTMIANLCVVLSIINKFIVLSSNYDKYMAYVYSIMNTELSDIETRYSNRKKYSKELEKIYAQNRNITNIFFSSMRKDKYVYQVKAKHQFYNSAKNNYLGIKKLVIPCEIFNKKENNSYIVSTFADSIVKPGDTMIYIYSSKKTRIRDKITAWGMTICIEMRGIMQRKYSNIIESDYADIVKDTKDNVNNTINENLSEGILHIQSLAKSHGLFGSNR